MTRQTSAPTGPSPEPGEFAEPAPLFDRIPLARVLVDPDGRVVQWSPVAETLFGYGSDEVLGRDAGFLFTDLAATEQARVLDLLRGEQGLSGAAPVRLADGSRRRIRFQACAVPHPDGRTGALILASDEAELERTETDLAVLDALFTQAPVGFVVMDTDLRFRYVNAALATMNDLPAQRHLGLRPDEVVEVADMAAHIELHRGVLETGTPVVDRHVTGHTLHQPDLPRAWSISLYRLDGPDGRVLGLCGMVIDTTERNAARREAADAQARLALLNEATARIGTTLDLARTVREMTEVAVPAFCDQASVDLLESCADWGEASPQDRADSGELMVRRVASLSAISRRDGRRRPRVDPRVPFPASPDLHRALETGRSLLVVDAEAPPGGMETFAEALRDSDLTSGLAVPLIARGAILGIALFGRSVDKPPFSLSDMSLAEELAARAAVCVDNARLYAAERNTALILQRSLLPPHVPEVPGAEVAVRYHPGSLYTEAGGDWFDVIPLPGGRVALTVGDVMGHGVRAAAIMGQLRTAVRTLAGLELDPALVLTQLDDIAQTLGEGHIATCVFAVYDPANRTCAIATAGHVPPVVVEPDGVTNLLDLPTGAPLGVGGVAFATTDVQLDEGSLLVLYTDGLVESRERDLDAGLDTLRKQLSIPAPSLDDLCDTVLAAVPVQPVRDDVAVLVARVRGLAEDQIAIWTLAPEPESVARARDLVRKTLGSWGLAGLVDVTELLVSELVTNALRHAEGPIRLRLVRDRTLFCEVFDLAQALPLLRHASSTDESGRGLHLVSQLAKRWGSRRTGAGKIVWFEQSLPRGYPGREANGDA